MNSLQRDCQALQRELSWLQELLLRAVEDVSNPSEAGTIATEAPPDLDPQSRYGSLVQAHGLDAGERLIFILTLVPVLAPEILDILPEKLNDQRGLWGGVIAKQHAGILPTVQTALFILSGRNLLYRLVGHGLFRADGRLRKQNLLTLGARPAGEPLGCAPLFLESEVLAWLLGVSPQTLDDSAAAQLLTSDLTWDDLVVASAVAEQLDEISDWIAGAEDLAPRFGLGKHIRRGYRALFHGPSGTGKTLSATLLGQKFQRPVYRVNLAQTVSKYIGETEKNLDTLFRQAEKHGWILFFDEADALFGKRTEISDSHDRYANQGVAFLLQRVEDAPNLIILSSNLDSNIDAAFRRRFNSIIAFPPPDRTERLRLWQGCLGDVLHFERPEALEQLTDMDLSGGQIANIVHRLALLAVKANRTTVPLAEARQVIRAEMAKTGRHL